MGAIEYSWSADSDRDWCLIPLLRRHEGYDRGIQVNKYRIRQHEGQHAQMKDPVHTRSSRHNCSSRRIS